MKVAKLFAGIFGGIGAVLLVGSIGLCLFSLNAPVRMDKIPTGAQACSETFEKAIVNRDYDSLENCIYGSRSWVWTACRWIPVSGASGNWPSRS